MKIWEALKEERYGMIVFSAFLFGLWAGGYLLIEVITDIEEATTLYTWVDFRIPYIPEFVFIYLTIYPVFLLPFFIVRDWEFFLVFAYAYLTLMVICYATFLIYPVGIERYPVAGTPFTQWALTKVFNVDKPVNCFPSMHAAMAMISSLTLYEISRARGAFTFLLTLLIGASTLLTKQHYIVDIFAGYALAFIVYYIYFRQRIIETLRTRNYYKRIEKTLDRAIDSWMDKRGANILGRILQDKIDKILENSDRKKDEDKDGEK